MDSLILLSVEHNLKLMHQLSSERKFGNIIEAARSAKSWQQLRAYLDVFDEYCTYLSVRQKTQALAFLYELLIHREGGYPAPGSQPHRKDHRQIPPGLPQGGACRRPH